MKPLITLFALVMITLNALIGNQVTRDHARADIYRRAWQRVAAAITRVEALHARWLAGTLRPSRSRGPRPAAAAQTPPPIPPRLRLPARRGWLAETHFNIRNVAGQFAALLDRPDLAAFAEAAPQLRRILRPICNMLAVDPPAVLRVPAGPPRPARPRPAPPRPSHPMVPAPPLFRPLPDYVLAAVRAWTQKPA